MSAWRQVRHGLRWLTRKDAARRDVDEESAHYFDELVASLEAGGVTREEAMRQARIEMGSGMRIREQVQDSGWESGVSNLMDDVRYAGRRLMRSPGFALAAVMTLGLGLGAVTAMFAVIDAVLLRPLPYPDASRIVALTHTAPGIQLKYLRMSPSLYYTYREESKVFDEVALWKGNRATVTGIEESEEVPTLFVTREFLHILGVQPATGRNFTMEDVSPDGVRTVILADAYARLRFGSPEQAMGKSMTLDGFPREVIGVLPARFEFLDEKVSMILPVRLRREEVELIQFSEDGIAKVKPGVTLEQVNSDVARCLRIAPMKFPMNKGFAPTVYNDARITPTVKWLKAHLIGDVGETLWVLMAAVGILLLIASANVANLLLVRAEARQHELHVRAALGAGWGRILRDLLAESVLLSLAGGVVGLGLAAGALEWLAKSEIANVPRLESITLHPETFAFALLLSVLTGVLFGLIPVLKYAKPGNGMLARAGVSRSMTHSRERRRMQRGLLVAQVALAVVLLIGSGLMLRTFEAIRNTDAGFTKPEQIQAVRISMPVPMVEKPNEITPVQEAILRKFAAIPGVEAVSLSNSAPLEGGNHNPLLIEGHHSKEGKLPPVRYMQFVSPGFPASIGGRIVAGRDFTWHDLYQHTGVAMVSEGLAKEFWGSAQAAVGKRVSQALNMRMCEIVGVVGDIRMEGLTNPAPGIVFWPILGQRDDGTILFTRNADYLIRSPRAGTTLFVEDLRQALKSVNASIPLANVRTVGTIYKRSLARTSFALAMLGIAGTMALVLGVIGIYGVISYSVAQRRRDIGIRIALGSTPEEVTGMFLKEGLWVSAVGAVIGVVGAMAATRWMESLLFGVSPVDALTYAAVLAVLVGAALVASWIPARRGDGGPDRSTTG